MADMSSSATQAHQPRSSGEPYAEDAEDDGPGEAREENSTQAPGRAATKGPQSQDAPEPISQRQTAPFDGSTEGEDCAWQSGDILAAVLAPLGLSEPENECLADGWADPSSGHVTGTAGVTSPDAGTSPSRGTSRAIASPGMTTTLQVPPDGGTYEAEVLIHVKEAASFHTGPTSGGTINYSWSGPWLEATCTGSCQQMSWDPYPCTSATYQACPTRTTDTSYVLKLKMTVGQSTLGSQLTFIAGMRAYASLSSGYGEHSTGSSWSTIDAEVVYISVTVS